MVSIVEVVVFVVDVLSDEVVVFGFDVGMIVKVDIFILEDRIDVFDDVEVMLLLLLDIWLEEVVVEM